MSKQQKTSLSSLFNLNFYKKKKDWVLTRDLRSTKAQDARLDSVPEDVGATALSSDDKEEETPPRILDATYLVQFDEATTEHLKDAFLRTDSKSEAVNDEGAVDEIPDNEGEVEEIPDNESAVDEIPDNEGEVEEIPVDCLSPCKQESYREHLVKTKEPITPGWGKDTVINQSTQRASQAHDSLLRPKSELTLDLASKNKERTSSGEKKVKIQKTEIEDQKFLQNLLIPRNSACKTDSTTKAVQQQTHDIPPTPSSLVMEIPPQHQELYQRVSTESKVPFYWDTGLPVNPRHEEWYNPTQPEMGLSLPSWGMGWQVNPQHEYYPTTPNMSSHLLSDSYTKRQINPQHEYYSTTPNMSSHLFSDSYTKWQVNPQHNKLYSPTQPDMGWHLPYDTYPGWRFNPQHEKESYYQTQSDMEWHLPSDSNTGWRMRFNPQHEEPFYLSQSNTGLALPRVHPQSNKDVSDANFWNCESIDSCTFMEEAKSAPHSSETELEPSPKKNINCDNPIQEKTTEDRYPVNDVTSAVNHKPSLNSRDQNRVKTVRPRSPVLTILFPRTPVTATSNYFKDTLLAGSSNKMFGGINDLPCLGRGRGRLQRRN